MRLKLGGSRFAGLTKAARAISAEAEADLDETVVVINPSADDGGAAPAKPTPSEEDGDEEPGDKPKPADGEPAPEASAAPAAAASEEKPDAAAAERARVAEVFASEHSQGRERQAADMLQTSMSATEIVGLLEKAPKGSASDDMLGRIAGTPNPDLGAGTAAEPNAKAESKASWDRTLERLGWNKTPANAG